MTNKKETLAKLFEDTTKQVTSSLADWTNFLTTVGKLYKYPFNEQIMIFAQRPNATACAEYNIWNNSMNRYIQRGSTGIALIDPNNSNIAIKYVFDVADTGGRKNSRQPILWQYDDKYNDYILDMFADKFDVADKNIFEAIDNIAKKLAEDYYIDTANDISFLVQDSFLDGLDEENIRLSFEEAVSVSISYTIMKRMGLEVSDKFSHEDFLPIFDFNTTSTVSALGAAVSKQSEQVFREISKTIIKAERDIQNEQSNLQTRGRLLNSKLGAIEPTDTNIGQIWQNEENLSTTKQGRIVPIPITEREITSSPSRNRPNSEQQTGTDDERIIGETASTKQNDPSNGVGSSHEQPASTGRRSSFKRTDLQLNNDIVTGEQISLFPSEQQQVKNITGRQRNSKSRQPVISLSTKLKSDKLNRYMEYFFNSLETKYKGTISAELPDIKVWDNVSNKKNNLSIHLSSPIADMNENAFTYFNRLDNSDELTMNEALYNNPLISKLNEDKDFSVHFSPTSITVYFHNIDDKEIDFSLDENFIDDESITEPTTITPHYKEYLEFKNEYPDDIVLYQSDTCFKTFGDDAKFLDKQFDITAYYHEYKRDSDRVPILGFYANELESYVDKLHDLGKNVVLLKEENNTRTAFKTIAKSNMENEYTPFFQSYLDIKSENQDNIVLYRLGDFFEAFNDDAKIIAEELDLTLIKRNISVTKDEKVPMIGFPAHSLDRYTDLIKENGHNIIVCEKDSETVKTNFISASNSLKIEEAPEESVNIIEIENFRITDDNLGVGTKNEKIIYNLDAIRTLKLIESENRPATNSEKVALSKYVGWGGIPEIFEESNTNYLLLKTTLSDDEYSKARASVLNAHYTSPTIIKAIYSAVENMGFTTGNILEPSCGVGNFLGLVPDNMQNSKMYGVELDSITGRIAKQLYPRASIDIKGFEKTDYPDNFFDLAIGNVPFGDYGLNEKRYDNQNFKIHDHFFAKSLDKVRAGGVVAFVTSKGTLDKRNSNVRKYLAQRAELLGAIRLPNNAFKANAGTDVTSDIIFLQKRENPIDIQPDWVHLGIDENNVSMNSYFVENPNMVLGKMEMVSGRFGEESTCTALEGAELSVQLENAIKNIQGSITELEFDNTDTLQDTYIPTDPSVKNYSYTLVNGEVYYRENSKMSKPELSLVGLERAKGMVEIRDCVNNLIKYQLEDYSDEVIKNEQIKLNSVYDKFTEKYGLINTRGNALAFNGDNSYYLLASLEDVNEDGTLKAKADMFTKRTIKKAVKITSVDTPSEALAVSLSEKAKIDIDFMSELTGKNELEIYNALNGVIFMNPMYGYTSETADKYVTSDEYLSGNVREKLVWAKRSAELCPDDYAINVEALEKAIPEDLDASEIEVRLGATWIDKKYIEQFMYETFQTPQHLKSGYGIKVKFANFTGEWSIKNKNHAGYNDVSSTSTFGTSRANAYRILVSPPMIKCKKRAEKKCRYMARKMIKYTQRKRSVF